MKKNARDIAVSALSLAVIGGVVAAALAGTNLLTRDTIAARSEAAATAARRQVIDADTFDKAILSDGDKEIVYYVAEKDGAVAGYVFTATVTGKSAGLVIMTGITAQGTVSGVTITEENETAGYVNKVKGAGLLDRLTGREAAPLAFGTDIDGVSQATKTSKGVVEGVNQAITYYHTLTKGGGAS